MATPTNRTHRVTDEQRRTVDGTQLCQSLGIDGDEIEWRKEFTQFDDADAARLSELAPVFDDIAPDLVATFYDHLEEYEQSRAVVGRSSKGVDQLKQSQTSYLKSLGSGEYGPDYFARRARIGKIHDMLGMGPKFYLGAYTLYYQGIFDAVVDDVTDRVAAESDGDVEAALEEAAADIERKMMSVIRLLTLDQQVAMDTYIESFANKLESQIEAKRRACESIDDAVTELQSSATDVAAKSKEISDTADAQSEQMETVSDEVSNLSATVEEIAASAAQVEKTSENAETLAAEGQDAAEDAIDMLGEVRTAADEAAGDVGDLEARAEQIGDIVDVIDDIADQTNLLALNANIEAARAGDAGAGFAVVANEVKELAAQSRQHATDIESEVDGIQDSTQSTAESLEQTVTRIERSIEDVEDTLTKLDQIVEAVEETADGIREVSRATDEQAASTEELASIVDQAAADADDVAAAIREVAAANDRQMDEIDAIAESAARLASE